MWIEPEKRDINPKKGTASPKKGTFWTIPKTPESLYPCGFAACPRARARKNKKKQEKNRGWKCADALLLWTSRGTINSPPEGGEQGPQRRGLRPPGPPWACGPPPSSGRLPPLAALQVPEGAAARRAYPRAATAPGLPASDPSGWRRRDLRPSEP